MPLCHRLDDAQVLSCSTANQTCHQETQSHRRQRNSAMPPRYHYELELDDNVDTLQPAEASKTEPSHVAEDPCFRSW